MIGILGGMGTQAGLDFCNKLAKLYKGKTDQNYRWHYYHFVAMAKEFEYRRGKKHATFEKLGDLLAKEPINIPRGSLTEFAQAMSHYPDCMVPGDAVQAYRNYYHMAKSFAKWDWGREAPSWWKGYQGA